MREIIAGIHMMEGLRGANVYLLESGNELTLVDSGLARDADRISAQIQSAGLDPAGLRTLILTHAHGDHTGGAAELVRRFGVKIMAHRDEVPYIEKMASMPARSFFRRILLWASDHLYFRRSACKVDRILQDGERIDAGGGLTVIHTPGHTPGSICLYQPRRKILICGDTLFNENPMTGRPGLQPSLAMISFDTAQVRESIRKLLEFPVEIACFGHGGPILEKAGERIKTLMDNPNAGAEAWGKG